MALMLFNVRDVVNLGDIGHGTVTQLQRNQTTSKEEATSYVSLPTSPPPSSSTAGKPVATFTRTRGESTPAVGTTHPLHVSGANSTLETGQLGIFDSTSNGSFALPSR